MSTYTPSSSPTRPGAPLGRRIAVAVVPLAALWWLLSDGAGASWLVGLPTVAAAAWAFVRLGGGAGPGLSAVGMLRFVPWFLWESLRGGADVLLRVMAPRPRVSPGFARYPLALSNTGARIFFVGCISLVPGTLAAALEGDELVVHVLDVRDDTVAALRPLERAVGAVFRDPGVAP